MRVQINQIEVCESKSRNLEKVLNLIDGSDADLHIFPEYLMGVSEKGITRKYVEKTAEFLSGSFSQKIIEKSREKGVSVVYTLFLKENGKIFNAES